MQTAGWVAAGTVAAVLALSACGSSGTNNVTSATSIAAATTTTNAPPATAAASGSGSGGTAAPSEVKDTLLKLDAPGKDFPPKCADVPVGNASYPKWATNAVAVVQCAPSSLTGGGAIGMIFDSYDDLHTNLVAYNTVLLIDASSAATVCPPTDGGPIGVVVGGGKGGANSVFECRRFEGSNRPAIVWTNLANNELWAAQGPVGMSTDDLVAWYHTNTR